MIGNLKKRSGYSNFQQRTVGEFLLDVKRKGWKPTVDNYIAWSKMRMDPTDLLDVTHNAYTYLIGRRSFVQASGCVCALSKWA